MRRSPEHFEHNPPTQVTTNTGGNNTDDAIDKMEQAFNRAITKSAEITATTTEKKVALDAAKQRPQN